MTRKPIAVAVLALCLFHCESKDSNDSLLPLLLMGGSGSYRLTDDPYLIYQVNSTSYLLRAFPGSSPINLKSAFNAVSPLPGGGSDEWVNISRGKEWFVLSTERFGMAGWAGLAVIRSDLSEGSAVTTPGGAIHPAGFGAITTDGATIVYPDSNGLRVDLYVTTLSGSTWSDPLCISSSSPYQYNAMPALSHDGSSVVFDCGPVPYGQEGTALCRVDIDGSDCEVLYEPDDFPGGTTDNALHHPSYAPDGTVVFEGDWNGEQIYRLTIGGGDPTVINDTYSNDNSPTVLPDGRVVSLWLGRAGGPGYHELKIMDTDGSDGEMLLINVDVADTGIGSGE